MTTCLKDIARCFPKSRGIIAYGSAAFQQPGLYEGLSASHDAPMLDMIFAADNPLAWHREAWIIALTYQSCAACHKYRTCCTQSLVAAIRSSLATAVRCRTWQVIQTITH